MRACLPLKEPVYSLTLQAPFQPFLFVAVWFESSLAMESASIGFSATISTVSIPAFF